MTGQELDRAEAEAAAAQAQQRAAAARAAEQRVGVGFHVVRAPFAGTVGDVVARLGDFVTASAPLTSITQGGTLELAIRIPPDRARLVRPGTPVEVLDGEGKVLFVTELYFVAPEADPRTQLVDVSAIFQNTIGLRPSEMVRTRIVYGTTSGAQGAGALHRAPERAGVRVRRRATVIGSGRRRAGRFRSVSFPIRATSSKRASPRAIASPSRRSSPARRRIRQAEGARGRRRRALRSGSCSSTSSSAGPSSRRSARSS